VWENGEGKIAPQAGIGRISCGHLARGALVESCRESRGFNAISILANKKVAARNADSSGIKRPVGDAPLARSNWGTRGGSGGHLAWVAGPPQWRHGSGESRPATAKLPVPPPLPSVHPSRGRRVVCFCRSGSGRWRGLAVEAPRSRPRRPSWVVGLRRNARGARMRVGLARAEPQERASRGGPTKSPTPRVYSPPVRGPRHFQGLAGSPGPERERKCHCGSVRPGRGRRAGRKSSAWY